MDDDRAQDPEWFERVWRRIEDEIEQMPLEGERRRQVTWLRSLTVLLLVAASVEALATR